MYISKYPSLPTSFLFKKTTSNSLQDVEKDGFLLFSKGRDAIRHSIKMMCLSTKDNVLVPSYVCYSAVEPFLSANIRVVYFDIDRSLEIDWEDLCSKIDSNTKAILIVHYFGFYQTLSKIVDICRKKKIYLIEDCAHTFCQRKDRNAVIFGDLAIFSLRKIFPIPDGGALMINNPNFDSKATPMKKRQIVRIYISLFNLLLSRLELRMGLRFDLFRKLWELWKGLHLSPYIRFDSSGSLTEIAISSSSRRILRNIDYSQVTFRRRRNFEFLLKKLSYTHKELLIFRHLPEGVLPLAFPILVKERNQICKEMLKRGFGAYPWPFLPEQISKNDFADTFYLSDHLLLLPIHQDVEEHHLEKMYESLLSLL